MVEVATKRITQKVDEEIRRVKRPSNPFSSACRHITSPQFTPVDKMIIDEKEVVRFAFISFDSFNPNDFEDDFIPLCGQCQEGINAVTCRKESLSSSLQKRRNCHRGLDVEACNRKALKRDRALRAESLRHYQNALTEAFAVPGVDVVVVNELGIPASPTGPTAEFFRRTKSWAKRKPSPALIIAGSFHDARTKYNTGYIFTPESPDFGYAFHKQVSATGIGEYISVPPRRQSVIIRAFGFKIGVIICLDLLDYSTVVSLVDMRDTIDFILVPSHSEPEEVRSLEKVAKIASQAMPGGVGIVNCHHGKTRSSTMHIFGDSQIPVVDQALADGSGWLSIYEVEGHWFQNKKKRAQDDIQLDLEWLFRFPTISRA